VEKAAICDSIIETKAARVVKPLAVIDKSLLQGICELPSGQSDDCIGILQAKTEPVVTPILIEETIVSYLYATPANRPLFQKMLSVIQSFYPCWMETPLELIFREFVLQQEILDTSLNPQMGEMLFDAVKNPDSLWPEAATWLHARRQEKDERLKARLEHQTLRENTYGRVALHFPSHLAFMDRGIKQLCVEVDFSSELKMNRLYRYLGRNLIKRHPAHKDSIEMAFSEATFDSLDKTRFTRNYLLAEIVYDLGTISSYANASGNVVNVLSRNRCKQINDEDDQQYVAAALASRRLLTCDEGMHSIASLFSERGIWTGKPVHIPRLEIHRLDDFLQ
jgi:hypothetical protein